jgi:iron(III)-enterobactin esterase
VAVNANARPSISFQTGRIPHTAIAPPRWPARGVGDIFRQHLHLYRKGNNMKSIGSMFGVIILIALCIQDSFCVGAPQAAPSKAPATQPTTAPTRGRRGRGAPITTEEQAEVAKLAAAPAWKPGDGDGVYSVGPDYTPCPEQTPKEGVPVGKVESFSMNAADSKFYPPAGLRGANPTRKVTVYTPAQYQAGKPAPFIISADAYGANRRQLPNILDNMIAAKRLPAMIAIMVANGGGDGQGSERGLEYDTVSGKFAEFAEAEILPRVEREYGVTLSKDPDARMTLGGSSGGAVAFTMAWFHPELYHRALIYSGTFVNQQSPLNPELPHGAWEYHERLIANSPPKPIRVWLEVGERDNGATQAASGFHNWVLANARMADVLKAKGYHYQLIYAKNAGHTDGKVIAQTYPQALEWVWSGYAGK